jgi:hypothetical protein
VLEVNVPVTVPAGTFQTVHLRTTYTAPPGSTSPYDTITEEWNAIGDSQTVKQITTDSTGKVTTTVRTQ